MKRYLIYIACICILLISASDATAQLSDSFFITIDSYNEIVEEGGTGYDYGNWEEYPSHWIITWFYDHPFDPERGKIIHIEFDAVVLNAGQPGNLDFAVSWSTPEWSDLGYGDYWPPWVTAPEFNEPLYIEKSILLDDHTVPEEITHYIFDYTIYDYNPEWISVDVRGENVMITNGVITHECVVESEVKTWGAVKTIYR